MDVVDKGEYRCNSASSNSLGLLLIACQSHTIGSSTGTDLVPANDKHIPVLYRIPGPMGSKAIEAKNITSLSYLNSLRENRAIKRTTQRIP